jgi:uncharacterized protein YoxC
MTTTAVTQARAALAQAEQVAAAEHRVQLVERLRTIREELLPKREQLEPLAQTIRELQAKVDGVRQKIDEVTQAMAALDDRRPLAADYLGSDSETSGYFRQRKILGGELDRLIALRGSLPNLAEMRWRGVQLRQRVEELQYAESCVLNELAGDIGVPAGTVSGVF